MASKTLTWLVGLVVLALIGRHANGIIECQSAISILMPCLEYLTGQSNSLNVQCCQGASTLNSMVHSKPDLKSMCQCLKTAAAELQVVVPRAKSLPNLCHIQVPVPLDPNIDCNGI